MQTICANTKHAVIPTYSVPSSSSSSSVDG